MGMSTLMVVGAVMASLAFGVLVAYGICQVMFRMFSFHAVSAEKQSHAGVRVAVEG
jgi:hypothetical protein